MLACITDAKSTWKSRRYAVFSLNREKSNLLYHGET